MSAGVSITRTEHATGSSLPSDRSAICCVASASGAHSRDGDQQFQAMVITDSRDRDHARRRAERWRIGEHD
jgi:hypothetical protein